MSPPRTPRRPHNRLGLLDGSRPARLNCRVPRDLPAVFRIPAILLCLISITWAAEPVVVDRQSFYERVCAAAERGDNTGLHKLLDLQPPPPPEHLAAYVYYTALANAYLDIGRFQPAVRMIQLAGKPPIGTPDQAWIAGAAYLQLADIDAAAKIQARYERDTPPFEFLSAFSDFLEWRKLGPAHPQSAEILARAARHIEKAAGNLAQTRPDFHRRFLILSCNIREAIAPDRDLTDALEARHRAYPQRAAYLRIWLASKPFDQEDLEKAAPVAGFSPDEVAIWTRYRDAWQSNQPTMLAYAAAQLAELPEREEFDLARLTRLRDAMGEHHEITDPTNAHAASLLHRYAELAIKLSRPADAYRASQFITTRSAAVPAEQMRYADTALDLAKLSGETVRALQLIHEQARTSSRDLAWLTRHVDYVQRHDTLRATHAFLNRLTQLEPSKPAWKIALADLPDRAIDNDQQLADAEELLNIAAARLKLTPAQFDAEPENVLISPDHRLTLYAEIFAEVPGKFVPPSRTWANYEKALAESAEHPLLEREYAEQRRLVFRKIVERCYKERPDHPVIAAQYRRLVAADEATARAAKAQAEVDAAAAARAARAAANQTHNSTATIFLNSVRSAQQLEELNKKKEQRKAYLLRTVGDGDTLLAENNKISEVDRENSQREWEGRKTIRVADRRVKNDFDLARYQRLRRRLCADCSGIGLAPPKSVPGGTRYFKCQTCSGDGLSRATGWQVGPNENPRIEEAPFRFLEAFTIPHQK